MQCTFDMYVSSLRFSILYWNITWWGANIFWFASYWCFISTLLASCLVSDFWRWLYYLKVHWLSFIDLARRHATNRLPSSCNFANPDGANICLASYLSKYILQCGQMNVFKTSKQLQLCQPRWCEDLASLALFFQLFFGSFNICEKKKKI